MSLETDSKRVFGVSHETLVRRILRNFDAATPADVEAGSRWYDEAGDLATNLGANSGFGREVAAAVIAHLSPRTTWTRNVSGAIALLTYGEKYAGIMQRNFDNATAVCEAHRVDPSTDPLDSFNGPKTRRFYLNILGDRTAVTVDVWACVAAGVSDTMLGRKGAYAVLENAYRVAARRRGVDPSTMQATAWIVVRGGRAA